MPQYERYYAATEAKAAAELFRLCPQQVGTQCFTSENARQLDGLFDGTLTASSRLRNDTNQPPFRPEERSVEDHPSSVSSFSMTVETVHRDKFVHHDRTSEESTGDWKNRSGTPSPGEPSPRRVRIATPPMSVMTAASSDGSDDDLTHL